jgi:hypothetical protein
MKKKNIKYDPLYSPLVPGSESLGFHSSRHLAHHRKLPAQSCAGHNRSNVGLAEEDIDLLDTWAGT